MNPKKVDVQLRTLLLLVVSLLVIGCDDGPTGTDTPPEPGIVGLLLDAEGNPALDAPVGVIFDVNPFQGPWPPEEFGFEGRHDEDRVTRTFRFTLPETGTVTFTVQDIQRRPVKILVDSYLMIAGEYELVWDGTNEAGDPVSNGLYGALIEIEETGQAQEASGVLINYLDLNFGVNVGELVRTDNDGRFRIPFTELPLGEAYPCPGGIDGLCTIPLNIWIQSAQGIGRVRQPVHPGGLTEDLEVALRMDYLPD